MATEITFTLTQQEAADVIAQVPRVDPNHDAMPSVFEVLWAQYQAQLPPEGEQQAEAM